MSDASSTAIDLARTSTLGHEGLRLAAYRDSKGILTVGRGLNLETSAAPFMLAAVGAKYAEVCRGVPLTNAQADKLFDAAFHNACQGIDATLPDAAQAVLIEMQYQMGTGGVAKFAHMTAALKRRDFATAALEMMDSTWHKDTPRRCEELAIRMARADIA